MSFSLRGLFQRGAGSNEPGQDAPQFFAGAHPQKVAGSGTNSLSSMQASPPQQFPAGASPFQIGGNPLFRTAGNEPIAAPPINSASGMSPFSVIGATPTNAPLTVGDVINQLPPEVVRMGALPAEQPLSLPPALLENALRSGQAALPVFELYRVCPALFQVPISPQDPRLVALPAAKLPGLIAQAREGQGAAHTPAAAPSASPFTFSQPAAPAHQSPVGSPFQMSQPAAEPAAQQPPASPFSLGANPSGSPFGMSQQPAEAAPAASPGSPFSLGASPNGSPFGMSQQPSAATPAASPASPFSLGAAHGGSPFGMSQQPSAAAPAASPASPFSLGAANGGSPFGMSQQPAATAPSASPFAPAPPENWSGSTPAAVQPQASISTLFTPASQQRASAPSDMATAPGMPFGSPFVSAMKEAAPQAESPPAPNAFAQQPQAPAPNAFAQQPQAAPQGNNTPASSGMAKLGFAAVLGGYSVEELGFNPATLPAWITTSVQASVLNEQISSGNIIVELGMLIDGISDFGFRNTLTTAKRDFKIKLPQNEVFHSLTNMSAAPAAAAAIASPSPALPPARFSVQPNPPQQPAQDSQPMFAASSAPAPAEPPPMFGSALSPFMQSQPAAVSAPVPAVDSAQPSAASGPFAFSPPAESAPPPALAAFAFPAAQPTPASQSKPLQPLAGAFQSFGTSQSLSEVQPASPPSSPLAGTVKPFDPFASSSTGPLAARAPAESGFNSAQLLGQIPAPQQPASAFAPAPETKPATSLFATPVPAPFQPTPSFAPALEEIPSFSTPASPAPQPASRGLFSPPAMNTPLFSEQVVPQVRPEPKPAFAASPSPTVQATPAATPAKMAEVKHSFLGLSPLDTQTDQLLLRALLGTEEKLAAPRVVELLALQQGLSACVCLHGSHVLSHADSSKADAMEFQRQAPDIARQLRGLAPLIGIEGAETFTLNAGGRLLTFCFPGDSIIGVLHDHEPSTGMRDKITLIARELARMLG